MAGVLDYDILEKEFELQLHYYFHFQTNTSEKDMNHLILGAGGRMLLQLFFQREGSVIR